jgi:hypothetical protein
MLMSMPLMRPQSAPLRFIATRLQVADLPIVVRQPGAGEALRITIQYHDARHPDQIGTLIKTLTGGATLTVIYRRAETTPLTMMYEFEAARYQALGAGLRRLSFDKLDDAPDTPWFGADLWLVERAAGTFHHDVIIAPATAVGAYSEIVTLFQTIAREVIRTINP